MNVFAVTMGDASGVGPELVLRSQAAGELGDDVIVYGDAAILEAGCRILGLEGVAIRVIDRPEEARSGRLNVIDAEVLLESDLTPGRLSASTGAAARRYVVEATGDALAGKIAGLVTLPMNKEATRLTDPTFCGHTELIAELCSCRKFCMMLAAAGVVCTHVSTHCSMQESIARCQTPRILEVIRLTYQALLRFHRSPRLAVCGLNPHAGESNHFGQEDSMQILPAVRQAVAEGIAAEGPLPADTVFYQAVHNKRYHGIVCMYHDQGHAPMKLLAFDSGVNVTLGLPIIRTSVDHGTAFDIAWQGKAFTRSLLHALQFARQLAA